MLFHWKIPSRKTSKKYLACFIWLVSGFRERGAAFCLNTWMQYLRRKKNFPLRSCCCHISVQIDQIWTILNENELTSFWTSSILSAPSILRTKLKWWDVYVLYKIEKSYKNILNWINSFWVLFHSFLNSLFKGAYFFRRSCYCSTPRGGAPDLLTGAWGWDLCLSLEKYCRRKNYSPRKSSSHLTATKVAQAWNLKARLGCSMELFTALPARHRGRKERVDNPTTIACRTL